MVKTRYQEFIIHRHTFLVPISVFASLTQPNTLLRLVCINNCCSNHNQSRSCQYRRLYPNGKLYKKTCPRV